MSIRLKVLIENTTSRPDLESEHGLSFYVETPQSKIIFDCGQSGAAWRNAEKLGVDLRQTNFVAISHAHYDHAGGFPSLVKIFKPKILYTGVNFWKEKFSRTDYDYEYKGASFTFQDLARWRIAQIVCEDFVQLDDMAWLMGNFERRHKFETIPEKYVRGNDKIPDNFEDEICLILREGDGVAVVAGCSHVGILNIVSTVQKRLDLPVRSIIGGIHLSGASAERVDKTFSTLKNWNIKRLALCHCSGKNLRAETISTGSVIEVI